MYRKEDYLERIMTGSIKEDCPVHKTLELLSGKWRTHIIYEFNEIPPHVEYSLTEKGKALLPVFFEISKWGEENLGE